MGKFDAAMNKNEIIVLGESLRQIDQKILKPGQENGTVRIWYQGGEPYFDIFFELKNEQIVWFQFTLRGKSLSWDRKRSGIQTGVTNELKMDDLTYYAASKTIETDTEIDSNFINLVQLILQTRAREPIFAKTLALLNQASKRDHSL